MPLVVIAVFDEVYEGEVAASLLRSAGIQTFLHGEQLAKFYPFKQRAWGGARLAVMEDDADDARAILASAKAGALEPEDPSDLEPAATGIGWTVASLALAFTTTVDSGWTVNGLRRRRRPLQVFGTILLALVGLSFVIANIIWIVQEPGGG